jgi:TRAP-type C4-dicarboxylate transport system substrate-binding protein
MLQRIAFAWTAVLLTALAPGVARAEAIKLKLAFYSSDQAMIFRSAVKPFVDAVNAEAKGLLEIVVYPAGALGKSVPEQHRIVLDGAADLTFLIPGLAPDAFPDNAAIELPGLFADTREATLAYTKLSASGALRGYEQLVVIGAYGTEPESLHVRPKVGSLADFAGLKVRTNNAMEGQFLRQIGAEPVMMPVNTTAEAIAKGTISGALVPPPMLYDMGIARVTTYHYFLRTSTAPLALVMSKKSFEALPRIAQDVIRKHSGYAMAARFIEIFDALSRQAVQQLDSDPRRTVLEPTPKDRAKAEAAFKVVAQEFAAKDPRRGMLLETIRKDVTAIRSTP